jgi:hypothetical protein
MLAVSSGLQRRVEAGDDLRGGRARGRVRPAIDVAPCPAHVRVHGELEALHEAIGARALPHGREEVVAERPGLDAAEQRHDRGFDVDGAAPDAIVGEPPGAVPGLQVERPRGFVP